MDGAAGDVADAEVDGVARAVFELDIGELLSSLVEDLDAGVDAVGVEIVVVDLLAKEVDGGGAGDLGLPGHGELFGGRRGPLVGVRDGGKDGCGESEGEQRAEQGTHQVDHVGSLCRPVTFGERGRE